MYFIGYYGTMAALIYLAVWGIRKLLAKRKDKKAAADSHE